MSEHRRFTELPDLPSAPWELFRGWYDEAEACPEIRYAHAMCLATVDADGLPDARTVLLKHLDDDGPVFFTDATSPKARQLEQLPEAALVFYWEPLERQVRWRGSVDTASDAIADACFERRPRASRITTWASRQSERLASRRELDERYEEMEARFDDDPRVPRPAHWQAYRLRPRTVEFWQARARRLHDRLLYTRIGDTWETSWLYP